MLPGPVLGLIVLGFVTRGPLGPGTLGVARSRVLGRGPVGLDRRILDLLVPSALVVRCHAPPVPRQRGGETATYPGSSRDLFAVKRGQAVGYVVELAPRALGQPAERLDPQPALVVPPRPPHLTLDQEGGHGVRRLRVEHSRSVFLRKDLGPAGGGPG